MIIEALLEQSIIDALQSELGDDVQIVGSRLETKVEDSDKKTIVAVASAFRNHDAFSLSLINVPVAISVATRVEGDAQSQEHNSTVEKIVDILVGWHKDGEAMEEALSNRKFLAGELRMDGGTTQTYDREHMCWTDAININIRGAEKFIKPTVVINLDGTKREFEIAGTIENEWISDPYNVKEVSIGDEVTAIGERSFTGFGQLSSIVVPKNVTSIGNEAFSYTGLRNVVIENGVTELGYGVFSYSNSLSSITLPSTLLKIGADVFEECGGLSSIVLPKSVVDISRVAFRYSRLSAVTMDGRTKAETKAIDDYPWGLGAGSIIHCTDGDIVVGLTKVTYTDGRNVELDIQGELGEDSIPDREYISELDIGNAVTSIGEAAFDRCAYLDTVIIPESVETIGTQGFSRTVRLTSITIKGNGLKVIGFAAFAAATALSSISLPDSVVSIGRSAFEDCVSLTSIDIPASVQTMDREVFFGCSELMSVTFSGKTKSTVQGMDNYSWELPSGCVLHCSDGDITI